LSDPQAPAIVWFRSALRLADNGALAAAARERRPLVACYVLDTGAEPLGAASRWWLHHSLVALAAALRARGAELILRRGRAAEEIARLVEETGAAVVHADRRHEPEARTQQTALEARADALGFELGWHEDAVLFPQQRLRTAAGKPFQVFTPFWKACLAQPAPPAPRPAPARLLPAAVQPRSDRLDDWGLTPSQPDWSGGLAAAWTPGEAGAQQRLTAFIDDGLAGYANDRDRPDIDGTSRLSPHLHFGELGPRQIWAVVRTASAVSPALRAGGDAFLRELGWREFSCYLLYHWPELPIAPFRPEFAAFPWREQPDRLRAWQRGRTGYPLVDAGMRQLWHSGWMHNRVRMVAASFLVKHLLIPWQQGAAWFWDTLVDADLANNSASWQWVAGSGADAAPYFRIFNPTLQAQKFDPQGAYVRRWVPELRALPDAHIHAPWLAPKAVLDRCGLVLGRDYPLPVVEHARARSRALEAYASMRGSAG
jgi:deoxyribodipyrimidine photo-lyase